MNAISTRFADGGEGFDPVVAEWSRFDAAGAVGRGLEAERLRRPAAVGYRGGPLPFGDAPGAPPPPAPAGGATLVKAAIAVALVLGAAALLGVPLAGGGGGLAPHGAAALRDVAAGTGVLSALGLFAPARG